VLSKDKDKEKEKEGSESCRGKTYIILYEVLKLNKKCNIFTIMFHPCSPFSTSTDWVSTQRCFPNLIKQLINNLRVFLQTRKFHSMQLIHFKYVILHQIYFTI